MNRLNGYYYSNVDDKNEMYTIINGIVTRVGLRPESINNGYEKWAEGITMAMTVKTSVLMAYINYSNCRG